MAAQDRKATEAEREAEEHAAKQEAEMPEIAEAFAVVVLMRDEMDARDWCRRDVIERMGDDHDANAIIFDLMGIEDPGILLGEDAAILMERAFGIDAQMWLRLDATWRLWKKKQVAYLALGQWMWANRATIREPLPLHIDTTPLESGLKAAHRTTTPEDQ